MKYVNKNVIKNRKNKNVYTKKSLFFYFFRKHSYDFFRGTSKFFRKRSIQQQKNVLYYSQ